VPGTALAGLSGITPHPETTMPQPKDPSAPQGPPSGVPPDRLSDDEPGAVSEHQEDVAGDVRLAGVPHVTPGDDRAARRSGHRAGND
jgi:hypothetical protein